MVRVSSRTFWPSAVRHSLRVTTRAPLPARAGLPTSTQTMSPWPGYSLREPETLQRVGLDWLVPTPA